MKPSLFLATLLLLAGCSEDRKARSDISEMEAKIEGLTQQLAALERARDGKLGEVEGKLRELAGETRNTALTLMETQRVSSESHDSSIQAFSNSLISLSSTFASTSVDIDPSQKGFSVARNKFGSYLIMVEDVQPYLDGHKIRLRIGNLTAGMLTGVTVNVTYGPRLAAPKSVENDGATTALAKIDPNDPKAREKWMENERIRSKIKHENFAWDEAMIKAVAKRKKVSSKVNGSVPLGTWVSTEVIIAPSKPEELGWLQVSANAEGVILAGGR